MDAHGTDPVTDEERFEEFVGTIAALSKEVQRIKAAESAKFGLQGADIMALYYLASSSCGMTAAELARATGVTRAAMSRTLARMEAEGMVDVGEGTSENVRYRAPVTLTETGREVAAQARKRIGYVMHAVSSALTEGERAAMYRSLTQVLDSLSGISRS